MNWKMILGLSPIALLVSATLAVASAEISGAESSGGGGDALILPDDTVILADPYIRKYGSRAELHPALKAELRRAGDLLIRFGAQATENFASTFIEQDVLGPFIEYSFGSSVPEDCSRIPVGTLPEGSHTELVACTRGNLTWIREDRFKQMSIREQAKLIIHERLRALKSNPPHEFITDVTNALETALSLYNDQANGKRPILSTDQVEQLELLLKRLVQVGLYAKNSPLFSGRENSVWEWLWDGSVRKNFSVSARGGGLISHHTQIPSSAYVGVGSIINSDVILGERSTVLYLACGNCTVGDDAIVHPVNFSTLYRATFGKRSIVLRSALPRYDIRIGEDAMIIDSTITAQELYVNKGVRIEQVQIEIPSRIKIGEKATLSSLKVTGLADPRADLFFATIFFGFPVTIPALIAFGNDYVELFDGTVTVKKGSVIQGNGNSVCPEGQWVYKKGNIKVRKLEDLTRLCVAKPAN